MENDNISYKKVITFIGAILAFSIGSGFSTGQELLQYCAAYGYKSILVGLIFFAIFAYTNYAFAEAGNTQKFTKGSEVFGYYCGPYIGAGFDYFSVFFCYLSYIVMVGGAAATFNQQYGVPIHIGAAILAVLACATVILGLDFLLNILGMLGPIIVGIALFIGVYSAIVGFPHISEGVRLIESGEVKVLQAGSNWFMAGASYGGFVLLWFGGFMGALGAKNRMKELVPAIIIGAVLNALACVIVGFALLANIKDVADMQIPNLFLAKKIWEPLANGFAVIIITAIYTTSVPLLWTASSRFAQEKTPKFFIATVFLAALGYFIAMYVPFNKLLNYVYVINGYGGFVLLLLIIVKRMRMRFEKKTDINHA